ncbi:MAG: hypothetical protein JWO59_55 [Chloroflexi bacterium]|nr:hypothetical protein [Chloroflexota bacterium]
MQPHKLEEERDARIDMTILVDSYDEEERAMAWYTYLAGALAFPFAARLPRQARGLAPPDWGRGGSHRHGTGRRM